MMGGSRFFFIALVLASTVACGDDDSSSTSGAGGDNTGGMGQGVGGLGGAGGAGGSGGGGGSGHCNDLALGMPVSEVQQSGTAPAPAGGTIEDGVFHLSALSVYPPTTANPAVRAQFTIEVSGTTANVHIVTTGDPTAEPEEWFSFDQATNGTDLSWTSTCPEAGAPITFGYTATTNEIILFEQVGDERLLTFTKQ